MKKYTDPITILSGVLILTACGNNEEDMNANENENSEELNAYENNEELNANENENNEELNAPENENNLLASENDGDFQLDIYQSEEDPAVIRTEMTYVGEEEEMEIFHYFHFINFSLEKDEERVALANPVVDPTEGSGMSDEEILSSTLSENESIEESVSDDSFKTDEHPAPQQEYTLTAEPLFYLEEDIDNQEPINTPTIEVDVTFSNE